MAGERRRKRMAAALARAIAAITMSDFLRPIVGLAPEDSRGRDHPGVVAALPNLQVRPIGQRRTHTDEDFVGSDGGDINLFDAEIFAAVENRRGHPADGPFELGFLRERFVGNSRHIWSDSS